MIKPSVFHIRFFWQLYKASLRCSQPIVAELESASPPVKAQFDLQKIIDDTFELLGNQVI